MPSTSTSPADGAIYSIRHETHFRYSAQVRESIMELRMRPLDDARQHCLDFTLALEPTARLFEYVDALGNHVHHFDIPGEHTRLSIVAESRVRVLAPPPLPDRLGLDAWEEFERAGTSRELWEMRGPSHFARPSPLLDALAADLDLSRDEDPLSLLRRLNEALHDRFDYVPQSTQADSPIDDALRQRRGVCQDFSHIMIALARGLGIPARYVSGYLFHRVDGGDRSAEDATHAWIEAWLPGLGWVGFDPTNRMLAGARHIRAAVGRDYHDVPPTRGLFRGGATSEMRVAVRVARDHEPVPVPWTLEGPGPVSTDPVPDQQPQSQQQ